MPPPVSFSDSVSNKSKERAPRACQRCRAHKIRCDGFVRPGGTCSACVNSKTACSYTTSDPKTTSAPQWYVESLEGRVEQLEALLQKLHPGETFQELGPPIEIGNWAKPTHNPPSEDQDADSDALLKVFEQLYIDKDSRFYGSSSNASFMKKALFSTVERDGTKWREWVQRFRSQNGRAERWKMPEWQQVLFIPEKPCRMTFPPEDLMLELIGHYFEHENDFMPVLHGPTFMAMVKSRLYERDQNFGGIVLIVCACGARRSDDRRSWAADTPSSAGWHYYRQVHQMPRPFIEPVSLFRLQLYALMVLFLSGECLTSLEWSLLGTGLRYAVDVGAHMKKSLSSSASQAERELWKRAFWTLFALDQIMSNALGRSSVIPLEEIDQDLPLEVDDNFWYHPDPSEAFKQPPNTPCSVSCFNAFIRLMHLVPKVTLATRHNSPETLQIALDHLADVDSALNQWLEVLPPQLLLDGPYSKDLKFLRQATVVHAMYYMTTILAHRSFIPSPSDAAESDSPALAHCTNAARSCTRALYRFAQRQPGDSAPWMWMTAGNAGIILVLNVWLADRRRHAVAKTLAVEDIKQCIEIIQNCSHRTLTITACRQHIAIQLADLLWELAGLGDETQPSVLPPTLKRTRPIDNLEAATTRDPVKIPRTDIQMTPPTIPLSLGHNAVPSAGTTFYSASSSDFSGITPEIGGTPPSTDSWFAGGNAQPGDGGQALLDALFPTGVLSYPEPFPIPNDAQSLLDLWSGTSLGTEWSIWDHYPVDPPPPLFENP